MVLLYKAIDFLVKKSCFRAKCLLELEKYTYIRSFILFIVRFYTTTYFQYYLFFLFNK